MTKKRTKTPAQARKNQTRENRWEEIIEGATRVFYRLGYRNASIRDIAAEIGLTSAALYYYVDSKDDLLVEIIRRSGRKLIDNLAMLQSQIDDPVEKVRQAIIQHVRILIENRMIFVVQLQERSELPVEALKDFERGERKYLNTLADSLRAAADAGLMDIPHPKIAALAIIGMCNWILRWYSEEGPLSPTEIGDLLFQLVFAGLRPR